MIRSFRGVAPRIAASALVTPVSDVLGDVFLADGVACWAGTVLRGDVHWIRAGTGSQLPAGTVRHVSEILAARGAAWRGYAAHFKATARPVPVT